MSMHYKLHVERLQYLPHFVCFRWYPSSRVTGRDCRTLQNGGGGRLPVRSYLWLHHHPSPTTGCHVLSAPSFLCHTLYPHCPCPWIGLHPLYSWTITTGLSSLVHRKYSVNIGWTVGWMDGWLGECEGRGERSRGEKKWKEEKKEGNCSFLYHMNRVFANQKWPCCEAHLIS